MADIPTPPSPGDEEQRHLGEQDAGESELPAHIHENLAAIEQLHERHRRGAGLVQRAVDQATRQFARPGTVLLLLLCVALWLLANSGLFGSRFDPGPFQILQLVLGIVSVCLTCMILTTQRRADLLEDNRAHLTLQLALLAERKSAKTIALLEELRRDLPMLGNRADDLAEQLAQPTDAAKVIERLVETSGEASRPESGEVI